MDRIESDWREVDMEDASADDIMEFFKMNATFSVDINCKDPILQSWIFKHKDWIKPKKGGE